MPISKVWSLNRIFVNTSRSILDKRKFFENPILYRAINYVQIKGLIESV